MGVFEGLLEWSRDAATQFLSDHYPTQAHPTLPTLSVPLEPPASLLQACCSRTFAPSVQLHTATYALFPPTPLEFQRTRLILGVLASATPASMSRSRNAEAGPSKGGGRDHHAASPSVSSMSVHAIPRGFRESELQSTPGLTDLSGGKQIWSVKLPDGVRPRDLDRLVIKLPRARNQGAPLASFDVSQGQGNSGGGGGSMALYSLASASGASTSAAQKEGLTSSGGAPGVGGGDSSAPTQLIAMAAGASQRKHDDEQEARRVYDDLSAGPMEMEGMRLLLPKGQAGALQLGESCIAADPSNPTCE